MRGSQREPATRCAPRLAALIMPPQTWSSPGSAQTCPSSCVTCASLEIFLTRTCWPAFDGQLRASVSASLSSDLPDHSWWQATTGVTCGGLGLRTALGFALPAFVASRIMCRPLVSTMVDHFSLAFGVPNQSILAEYDARTDAALARLVSTLPPPAAQFPPGQLDEDPG